MRGPILGILGILGLSQLGDGGRADARPVRHSSEEHGAAEVQSAAQETGICQQAAPQAPCHACHVAMAAMVLVKSLETCSKTVPFRAVIDVIPLLKYHDNT